VNCRGLDTGLTVQRLYRDWAEKSQRPKGDPTKARGTRYRLDRTGRSRDGTERWDETWDRDWIVWTEAGTETAWVDTVKVQACSTRTLDCTVTGLYREWKLVAMSCYCRPSFQTRSEAGIF
jgi:hypothetical protein